MRSSFTRMTPKPENMVTEPGFNGTIALLCVECGWEGTANPPIDFSWDIFHMHTCRLVSESVSVLD